MREVSGVRVTEGVGGWGGGLACWKNEATGWGWRLGALGPGLGSVRSILAGIVEAFLCVVTGIACEWRGGRGGVGRLLMGNGRILDQER